MENSSHVIPRKKKKLYANQFVLMPVFFQEIKEIEDNWIIYAYQPTLDVVYKVFFGISETNKKLVARLEKNCEMVIYGSVKINKGGDTILRAKQISIEE